MRLSQFCRAFAPLAFASSCAIALATVGAARAADVESVPTGVASGEPERVPKPPFHARTKWASPPEAGVHRGIGRPPRRADSAPTASASGRSGVRTVRGLA